MPPEYLRMVFWVSRFTLRTADGRACGSLFLEDRNIANVCGLLNRTPHSTAFMCLLSEWIEQEDTVHPIEDASLRDGMLAVLEGPLWGKIR